MGLRLAAVVAVAVIAIALAAAYLAGQHALTGAVPAGSSGSVAAYQSVVKADYEAWMNTPFNCSTATDASCAADLRGVLQKWLGDLGSFRTPRQFEVIDAQMRLHIQDMIQKFDAARAAGVSFTNDLNWLDHAAQGIAQWHAVTATQYSDLLQAESGVVGGCTSCGDLATSGGSSCASLADSLCAHDLDATGDLIALAQADLAMVSVPSQLANKNMTIQRDLAVADDALMRMNNALFTGDSAALKSGRAAFVDAIVAVQADLQS